MDWIVTAAVLAAALMHASWNALVKQSGDPLANLTILQATGTIIGGAAIFFLPLPAPASLGLLGASALVHVGYNFFLLGAYRHGALGLVYPIARGLSPLLVTLLSALFAGEWPGSQSLAGILLISLALFGIAFSRGLTRTDGQAVLLALATGVFIASYTVLDGLGARAAGHALAFAAWLFLLDGIAFIGCAWALQGRRLRAGLRRSLPAGIAGGLLSMTAYSVVIWALARAPMAEVSALRETSVLFAAAIGALVLREPFGWRRLPTAALIVAGVVLLRLA